VYIVMIKVPHEQFPTLLLQANSIYDCELEGVICHMAPSCNSKLQQSVQSVGAKRCHLANGTFFHQKIMIFQMVHMSFVCFCKKSKFKFIFLQNKDIEDICWMLV